VIKVIDLLRESTCRPP